MNSLAIAVWYASSVDKPKLETAVECARLKSSLAQVWQEWAVKVYSWE